MPEAKQDQTPNAGSEPVAEKISPEEKLISAMEENTALRIANTELEARCHRMAGSLKRLGVNPDKTEEPGKVEV